MPKPSSSSSSSLRSNGQNGKYEYTPNNYAATKNEVGVFTTPGYSEDIKPLWKFKNAEESGKSAEGIWKLFEGYRDKNDFVGMDICRKFIQMGRTRSLRYALRPGGRKYDPSTGEERQRTGKVYDQGKLEGAEVYEKWLGKCWDDECYKKAWESWREGKDNIEVVKDQSDVEDPWGEGDEKDQEEKKRKRLRSAVKGAPEVKAKDHPGPKKRTKKS